MRQDLYRYNAETCQYERTKLKGHTVIAYAVSVLFASAAILVGLLVAHDFLFDSDKEVSLRKENRALEQNFIKLAGQLTYIETSLQALEKQDELLHEKFFGVPLDKEIENTSIMADHNVLRADVSAFQKNIEKLTKHSTALFDRSQASNNFFGEQIPLEKEELGFFNHLPTIQPVRPWSAEKLISGFGIRVNPFHKGLYQHPGVDIALPRGAEVVATAPGTITQVKRSTVQVGYGNFIEISHGQGFVTRYAHLEDISVKQGQRVSKGQVIGSIGSSGGSIAPHLHYEILRDGAHVDPVHYMIEGLRSAEHHRLTELSKKQNQSLD